jgi:hypothetical protein
MLLISCLLYCCDFVLNFMVVVLISNQHMILLYVMIGVK